MSKIQVNFAKTSGKVKPMHAVNNVPVYKYGSDQRITNMYDFQAAGIPYARNHDASFFATYGSNHVVDVNFIFTDFDADPYAPESYDFVCTDQLMRVAEQSGAKTFYRLGSRIEHEIKKYNTLPPKDFKKWAVICEHIIRHYTEGWADGFYYDIEYWEIWNEPDLDLDDSKNKRNWGGTKAQFFELYDIAAKHLKGCFPHLKIGGPALACRDDWMEEFIAQCKAPLDFFSWHLYAFDVEKFPAKAKKYRDILDKYGFTETESILNEWNYVAGWSDELFLATLRAIPSLKGAAFTSAAMLACQKAPVDMLMYYDARPCGFNGLWMPYTYDRCKGYYSMVMFNELYRAGCDTEITVDATGIYANAAKNESGDEFTFVMTHFENECDQMLRDVKVELCGLPEGKSIKVEYYMLDEEHDMELVREEAFTSGNISCNVSLPTYASVMIKCKTE